MDKKNKTVPVVFGLLAILLLVAAIFAVGGYTASKEAEVKAVEAQNKLDAEKKASDQAKALLEKEVASAKAASEKAKAEALTAKEVADKITAAKAESDKALKAAEAKLLEVTPVASVHSGKDINDISFESIITETVTSQDLSKFLYDKVSFKGEDVDVEEKFTINGAKIALNGLGADKNFDGVPYFVTTGNDQMNYRFIFKDTVKMSDVTSDEPLEIVFLGVPMKITHVDANSITYQAGETRFMSVGDSVTIDGKVVKLVNVGDSSVVVSVDGVTGVIGSSSSKSINGIKVASTSIFNADALAEKSAELIIGKDVSKALNSGDDFTKGIDQFTFNIVSSGTSLTELVIAYHPTSNSLTNDYPPIKVGGVISFPNDYVKVAFSSVEGSKMVPLKFEMKFVDAKNDLTVGANAVVLSSSDRLFDINGEKVYKIVIVDDTHFYYYDIDSKLVKSSSAAATFKNGEYDLAVSMVGGKLTLTEETGKAIVVDTQLSGLRLGAVQDDAEATDVVYNGVNFGSTDESIITKDGIVIKSVSDNADNDEFQLSVPSDVQKATINVS